MGGIDSKYDLPSFEEMKSRGYIINTADEWKAYEQAEQDYFEQLLLQFIQISNPASSNNQVSSEQDQMSVSASSDVGKNDAAGAAMMFFIMFLSQEMMGQRGGKIAEESDKVGYLRAYSEAVNHLKELFDTSKDLIIPSERAQVTAQFNLEIKNLIDSLNDQGSAGKAPESAWLDDQTVSSVTESLQNLQKAVKDAGDLTQLWVNSGRPQNPNEAETWTQNQDGTWTMAYYADGLALYNYYNASTANREQYDKYVLPYWKSFKDEDGVRKVILVGTKEQLEAAKDFLNSHDVQAKGQMVDKPDGQILKPVLNAMDSMGTSFSSLSKQVQASIQYDEGEYNKLVNSVHDMSTELHKLEQTILNNSGK